MIQPAEGGRQKAELGPLAEMALLCEPELFFGDTDTIRHGAC